MVAAVVVIIQVAVFHGFYSGFGSPNWDFFSAYHGDAHAWWRDGGFFGRHDWVPYLWGGYPGTLDLQNSSWYLPVGLSYLLTGYNIQAAAILAALHVVFGGIGVYLLARQRGMRPSVAMFGLVAWSFASGFYANASHVDIARAYAWLPWVFVCTSPMFPWRRWWAPLLATFVFWQAILGMYPGAVIATLYAVGIWVIVHQVTERPKVSQYLAPTAASVLLAGFLTAPRFLTAYMVRGAGSPSVETADIWSWKLIGTLLYPYGSDGIPNDITMRSFFVPATVLALVVFVRWRQTLVRASIAVCVGATVLGLPVPLFQTVATRLPGLDLSRFRMADFRVFILLALVLLAIAGLHQIVSDRRVALRGVDGTALTYSPRPSGWALAIAILMAGLVGAIGWKGPFEVNDWLTQWAFLLISLVLALFACTKLMGSQLRVIVGILVGISFLSGTIWAYATTTPWLNPRAALEDSNFGGPVADMIEARLPVGPMVQRPGRKDSLRSAEDYESWWTEDAMRALYMRDYGLSGYINLKGAATWDTIKDSLIDPATHDDARAFWTAPGIVISSSEGEVPRSAETERCAQTGECGLLEVHPVVFARGSDFVYDVSTGSSTEVSFNEAYYAGWSLQACTDGRAECIDLPVRSGEGGQVVADIGAGESRLSLKYRLPGTETAWVVAGVSLGALSAWSVWLAVTGRRSRRGTRRPLSAPVN